LELESHSPGSPRLGFEASVNSEGEVRADYVDRRSAAAQAGLAEGDILQKMNAQVLHDAPANLLAQMKPGQEIKLQVLRGGDVLEIPYRLEANAETTYRVEEIAHPSPEQVLVREGWLQGKTTPAPHKE
jgi:S1-C subfamily serine protease